MGREEPVAWREGVTRHLVRPFAAEWPLLKVQRSVASQDDEWQVSAAAVIGQQNLAGGTQPCSAVGAVFGPLVSAVTAKVAIAVRSRVCRSAGLSKSVQDAIL